ncbi:MAG: hypothetical protein JWR32_6093 [Mycobacterium sp.]|nr:hypothetical protein [Mycobacterium sp.]
MNEHQTTQSVPSSFRYFQNRERPRAKQLAGSLSKRVSGPIELPDAIALELGRDRSRGDPVSDEFIDAAFDAGNVKEARRQVEQGLAGGIGSVGNPLPGIGDLFAHLDAEPPWLDWAEVERGAEVLRRYGTDAFRYFGLVSLSGYRIEMIHKPLVLTGAYTGGSAFRRYLETCKFWTEISEPNALRAGGEGRKTAVLIRILHSIIRHTIGPHREWDTGRLGVPLSQNAQFGTISLSFLTNQRLKVIGYLPSDDEILAHMHFWRYVGHLMGVESAFYPESIDDWWRVMYVMFLQDVPHDGPDSRMLGQSWVKAFGPTGDDSPELARRKSREEAEVLGWTRFFLSGSDYTAMELDDAGFHRWAPLRRIPANLFAEAARRVIPRTAGYIDNRRRHDRRNWLEDHLSERPAQFAPVERLSR